MYVYASAFEIHASSPARTEAGVRYLIICLSLLNANSKDQTSFPRFQGLS